MCTTVCRILWIDYNHWREREGLENAIFSIVIICIIQSHSLIIYIFIMDWLLLGYELFCTMYIIQLMLI